MVRKLRGFLVLSFFVLFVLSYGKSIKAIDEDEFLYSDYYRIDNRYDGYCYNLCFGDDGGIKFYELDGSEKGSLYTYEMDYENNRLNFSEEPMDDSILYYVEDEKAFIPNYAESYNWCCQYGYPNCIIQYDSVPSQDQIEEDNIRLKKKYIFNNQPLTQDQAYLAVYNYLFNNYQLYNIDHTYYTISGADDNYIDGKYQIYFRAYTGAELYYKVNPETGEVTCEELSIPVDDVQPEEFDAGFNAYNYVDGKDWDSLYLDNDLLDSLSGVWGSSSSGDSYPMGEYNNSYYVIFENKKAIYYQNTENGLSKISEYNIVSTEKNEEENNYRIFLNNGICLITNGLNEELSSLSYYVCMSSWGFSEYEYMGSGKINKINPGELVFASQDGETQENNDNNESITAGIEYIDGTKQVTLSSEMFERDNTCFYKDIALLSVVLSKAAYDGWIGDKDGRYIVGAYKSLGFDDENISLYSYPDSEYNNSNYIFSDNTYAFSIANRKLGEKTLLVIDFRGTKSLGDIHKDFKLWRNNIWDNICNDSYIWGGFYDFFSDYNVAIEEYYKNHPEIQNADNEGNLVVLVTGHSLGAAAANMAGRQLTEGVGVFNNLNESNVYVYTFACPLVDKNAISYSNIFNVVNSNDLVTYLPPFFELKRNGCAARFRADKIFNNHDCNTYIEVVSSDDFAPLIEEETTGKYRYVAVMCPVDIEIVRDDVVVGEVIDNEIVNCDESIILEVDDGHKFFVLPDDEAYTVNIEATDDGQMSFYCMCSESEDIKSYSEIEIKAGDIFEAEILSNDDFNKTKLNYENGKNNITIPEDNDNKTSGEQFTEIKNKKDKSNNLYIIIGLSCALLITLIIIVVMVMRNKRKRKKIKANDTIRLNNVENQKGRELDQNESESDQKVFCTECGKELSNKQRFCPVCGEKNKMYRE